MKATVPADVSRDEGRRDELAVLDHGVDVHAEPDEAQHL